MDDTLLLSPPVAPAPQVITLLSALTAAKALVVEKIFIISCVVSLAFPSLLLSPSISADTDETQKNLINLKRPR